MSVYVPNGRALDHDHYQYKLAWLERLRGHLDAVGRPDGARGAVRRLQHRPHRPRRVGPRRRRRRHPREPARARGAGPLLDWGLADVFRERFPDVERLYSWWDYRAGNFHKGIGHAHRPRARLARRWRTRRSGR